MSLLKLLLGIVIRTSDDENSLRKQGDFFIHFGFKPKFLTEISYRHEVLMTLILLAKTAQTKAVQKLQDFSEERRTHEYRKALEDYREAVETARYFHTDFKRLPLHWTELEVFVQKWKQAHQRVGAVVVEVSS